MEVILKQKINQTDWLHGGESIKNVHEFGRAIQENKHLYSDTEFMALCGEWLAEYENYLLDLIDKAKRG